MNPDELVDEWINPTAPSTSKEASPPTATSISKPPLANYLQRSLGTPVRTSPDSPSRPVCLGSSRPGGHLPPTMLFAGAVIHGAHPDTPRKPSGTRRAIATHL